MKSTRIIALIMAILAAGVGIVGILLLRSSEGVVRQDAGVIERINYGFKVPDPLNLKKGKVKEVKILFSNQSKSGYLPVSTVGFRLTYSGPGIVVNKDGKSSEIMYPSVLINKSNGWDVPVNRVEKKDGVYVLEFAAANLDPLGYESKEFTHIASIYIELEKGEDAIKISELAIDPEIAFIMSKADTPKNIYAGETNLRLQIVE